MAAKQAKMDEQAILGDISNHCGDIAHHCMGMSSTDCREEVAQLAGQVSLLAVIVSRLVERMPQQ